MFDLFDLPHVKSAAVTGDIRTDSAAFLAAGGKTATVAHCAAVAQAAIGLAKRFSVNAAQAELAALLHDISAVIKAEDMAKYAAASGWTVYEAERLHPFLLHQRVSG